MDFVQILYANSTFQDKQNDTKINFILPSKIKSLATEDNPQEQAILHVYIVTHSCVNLISSSLRPWGSRARPQAGQVGVVVGVSQHPHGVQHSS